MLYERVGEWRYGRRDVPFDNAKRGEFEEALAKSASVSEIGGMRVVSTDALEGRRFRFEKGWVMVRLSGTEPLVRIMQRQLRMKGWRRCLTGRRRCWDCKGVFTPIPRLHEGRL